MRHGSLRDERPVVRLLTMMIAATLVLLSSCNIFTPRESEQPIIPGRVDPLNFSATMAGTGEQFTKLRYEDLFSEAISYEDINSGVYIKSQLIQRVQQIMIQYENIQVQWAAGQEWTRNDTIILSGLTYKLWRSGNVTSSPDDSGSSDFIVVRDLEWHICQWRDVPAKQEKSFFSP